MAYRTSEHRESKLIPRVSAECTPAWAYEKFGYRKPTKSGKPSESVDIRRTTLERPTNHTECKGTDCACRCHG